MTPLPDLVLHVPTPMVKGGLHGFHHKLLAAWKAAGGRTEIRGRDSRALRTMGVTRDVHVVHNGRIRHPSVLNTALAYIYPFWYLDPLGVYADSSVVDAKFDPEGVDGAAADEFAGRLHARLVRPRLSRYDQPEGREAMPEGAIAIFLQGTANPVERARHMPTLDMIDCILRHNQGRPIVIKPHPKNRDIDTFEVLARVQGRKDVIVTDANIHDILARAAVSVSISSAVSLEGMMHRCPAIVFGKSDFHHCVETVRQMEDWPAALERALTRDYPFARYLHWFLQGQMINAGRPDMFDRVMDRIRTHITEMGGRIARR